jgi:hypothetical protein
MNLRRKPVTLKSYAILPGAFLMLLVFTAAVPHNAYATTENFWHVGANDNVSSVKEIDSDVNVVHTPNTTATSWGTSYWIGGDAGQYLTQPVLLAVSTAPSDQWQIKFEVYDTINSRDSDYWYSFLKFTPGGSVHLQDILMGNGQNVQEATDNNNISNNDYITFSGAYYPTTMSPIFAVLEGKDFTGSDYHLMDNIHFTSYEYYTTSNSWVNPQLFVYRYATPPQNPPTCITSSVPAAGQATVSLSC